MFLAQYSEGSFFDVNEISWVSVKPNGVYFGSKRNEDSEWEVTHGFEEKFLNRIQAVNDNPCENVESYYRKISNQGE